MGDPNGVLVAPIGSLWTDSNSVAGNIYINTNGATEWFVLAVGYNTPLNIIADPGNAGAISTDFSGTCNLTVAAGVAETRTLGAATIVGQTLRLNLNVLGAGGTIAITCATGVTPTQTVMTFNAARDSCELVGVLVAGALRWQIGWNNSVALS